MDKLSERIRYFSFHLGVLHGTKKQAQEFFRAWADEVTVLEAEAEEKTAPHPTSKRGRG